MDRVGERGEGREIERHVVIDDTTAWHWEFIGAAPVYDFLIRCLVAELGRAVVLRSNFAISKESRQITKVNLSKNETIRHNISLGNTNTSMRHGFNYAYNLEVCAPE